MVGNFGFVVEGLGIPKLQYTFLNTQPLFSLVAHQASHGWRAKNDILAGAGVLRRPTPKPNIPSTALNPDPVSR